MEIEARHLGARGVLKGFVGVGGVVWCLGALGLGVRGLGSWGFGFGG